MGGVLEDPYSPLKEPYTLLQLLKTLLALFHHTVTTTTRLLVYSYMM